MNKELIKFIELCLADGVISEKERKVIFRKAEELGVPKDECEIILEGLVLNNAKFNNKPIKQSKNLTAEKETDKKEKIINYKLDNDNDKDNLSTSENISNKEYHNSNKLTDNQKIDKSSKIKEKDSNNTFSFKYIFQFILFFCLAGGFFNLSIELAEEWASSIWYRNFLFISSIILSKLVSVRIIKINNQKINDYINNFFWGFFFIMIFVFLATLFIPKF
tara:strand:+ start:606 stop:1265 length:660 start_codon:yes stop_codon:yes gene_type:complete